MSIYKFVIILKENIINKGIRGRFDCFKLWEEGNNYGNCR